jgi:hypothetical protein
MLKDKPPLYLHPLSGGDKEMVIKDQNYRVF